MALNQFFNNWSNESEQDLYADLIIEAIQIFGYDVYYLPRTQTNFDDIYNQDDMSVFNKAYPIEMYVKSIDSFEGDGSFLSKFGLEIRDRVSLSVARKTFNLRIGEATQLHRPREGDLIFFPMTNKIFEIIYTDNRAMFYPLGSLPLFDLTCEVFEYNGEKFNTGIPAIDSIAAKLTLDVTDEDENYFDEEEAELRDPEYDNNTIQQEADGIVDLSEFDPVSKGRY